MNEGLEMPEPSPEDIKSLQSRYANPESPERFEERCMLSAPMVAIVVKNIMDIYEHGEVVIQNPTSEN